MELHHLSFFFKKKEFRDKAGKQLARILVGHPVKRKDVPMKLDSGKLTIKQEETQNSLLALVQSAVAASPGTLALLSSHGEGSCFKPRTHKKVNTNEEGLQRKRKGDRCGNPTLCLCCHGNSQVADCCNTPEKTCCRPRRG